MYKATAIVVNVHFTKSTWHISYLLDAMILPVILGTFPYPRAWTLAPKKWKKIDFFSCIKNINSEKVDKKINFWKIFLQRSTKFKSKKMKKNRLFFMYQKHKFRISWQKDKFMKKFSYNVQQNLKEKKEQKIRCKMQAVQQKIYICHCYHLPTI